MFNVLPESIKKKIRSAYATRRLFIVMIMILALQIIFAFFLLPSWVVVHANENELSNQMKSINNSASYQDADAASSVIESTNTRLKIIRSNLPYQEVNPILQSIIAQRMPGIRIDEFVYSSQGSATTTVSLSGISDSRETLMQYVKVLDGMEMFDTVDSPISNLAKDKDIDFVINLTLVPQT